MHGQTDRVIKRHMHFSYPSVAALTFVAFYFWQNCKIYLCATKYDLIQDNPEQRAVPYSAAKSLADGRRACPCCDVHKLCFVSI